MCTLRIVSTDEILHFITPLMIIIILHERSGPCSVSDREKCTIWAVGDNIVFELSPLQPFSLYRVNVKFPNISKTAH